MYSRAQPVANDGNGFGLFLRLPLLVDLPTIAIGFVQVAYVLLLVRIIEP